MTRHHPGFPGLPGALDPETVLERLRTALPECGEDLKLLACTVLDVRYRPGGPCWILYRIKARRAHRRSVRVLVSAKVLGPGELPPPVPASLRERFARSSGKVIRTPVIHPRDMGVVFYPYPIDTALPGLIEATDPRSMKKHLSRLWAPRRVKAIEVEVETRGYTPHARAAFFYRVLAEHRGTREPEIRRLVGKMHAKKRTSRLFADAWALWQAGRETLNLAPPVGYIAAAELTLQERVPGERLGGLVDQPGFRGHVRTTARMLADLHGLTVPLSTRRRPREEADNVHRWAGVLVSIHPGLASRIEALRDRLAAEIETRARLTSPIHADFHHTNVLVHGHRVTIIDFDEMAFGDPMVDVGRFMASLRVPARRAFGDITALDGVAELFLETYLQRGGGDPRRARLFEAAAMLIAAGSSFRVQRDGWEDEVALLVAASEQKLAESASTTLGTGDLRPPPLPAKRQALLARDGVYMQAVLDPHVEKAYGARITRCRVAADSSDERIRYALRGVREGDPWQIALQGIPGRTRGGRSLVQHLEELREHLLDEALLLPRPVAHLKPLSLLVWEVPTGTRFSSLLGTPAAEALAARIAGALGVLHRTPVTFRRRRSLDQELANLESRLQRLLARRPEVSDRARSIWSEVQRRIRRADPRTAPVIRTVHPHHVLDTGGGVAIDKIEDLTLSHPYLDAADFLARLTLLGIDRDDPQSASSLVARFREAYQDAGDGEFRDLAGFEAGALLRMACVHGVRNPDGATSTFLFDEAEERLAS